MENNTTRILRSGCFIGSMYQQGDYTRESFVAFLTTDYTDYTDFQREMMVQIAPKSSLRSVLWFFEALHLNSIRVICVICGSYPRFTDRLSLM
jgi:hypothetical protein